MMSDMSSSSSSLSFLSSSSFSSASSSPPAKTEGVSVSVRFFGVCYLLVTIQVVTFRRRVMSLIKEGCGTNADG